MTTLSSYCRIALENWFTILIPTLFPFMFLANIISSLLLACKNRKKMIPIFIITGFLFGMPIGAKLVSDLKEHHVISKNKGQHLVALCNLISPAYLIGVLFSKYEIHVKTQIHALFLFYLSPIIVYILQENLQNENRKFKILTQKVNNANSNDISEAPEASQSLSFIITNGLMQALISIGMIGGWMIAISFGYGIITIIFPHKFAVCIYPAIELCNGLQTMNYALKTALLYVSFSGLCCIMQAKAYIDRCGLSCRKYIYTKILQVVVLSLLFYGKALP